MISRRKLLGGIAASAAAAGTGLAFAGGRASGAPGAKAAASLPLTVVNKTGQYDNGSVWLYIVGNEGDRQVHVTPDGNIAPVALSDNGSDGFTLSLLHISGPTRHS
ncbi:glycosyl hydrolase, partial [Streptomyces albiflaviniger]|nr:glycosyl hydrolase [Streptomyces albiflaviniger]